MSPHSQRKKSVRFTVTISQERAEQLREISNKYNVEPAAVARMIIARGLDTGILQWLSR